MHCMGIVLWGWALYVRLGLSIVNCLGIVLLGFRIVGALYIAWALYFWVEYAARFGHDTLYRHFTVGVGHLRALYGHCTAASS